MPNASAKDYKSHSDGILNHPLRGSDAQPGGANMDAILPIYECVKCGKKFVVPNREKYAYKGKVKVGHGKGSVTLRAYYCSWSCLRAAEREEEEKVAEGRRIQAEKQKKLWEERRAKKE